MRSPSEAPRAERRSPRSKRLQPAAIVVWFLDDARRFILGLLAVIIARGNAVLIVSLLVLGLAIYEVLRYLRFTYRVEATTLIVEGGLLNRYRRSLPFARIQSVDVVQKLRHRALGVVELRIETAGGASTEAPLVALTPSEAEALRPLLLAEDPAADPGPAPPELVRLTPGDLVVAALTGGRVAVIAVILGYAQEVLGEELLESLAGRAQDALRSAFLVTILTILSVVALVLFLSVIATMLVYWNFTVRRRGARLVVERGLLERRRATVPLNRVQAVQLNENLLRRILNKASLSSVTAGYSPSNEEREEISMLLPIGTRDQALWLAGLALGFSSPPDRRLEPAPRRALVRRLVETVVLVLPVAVIGVGTAGARGLWSLALLLPFLGMAWLSYRALGFRLDSDYLAVQSGVFNRRTTIVPRANVQHLVLSRGPLQRPFDLATLKIGVPRARPYASDISRATAERTLRELYGT
ncbi:MAG: PH domain-containing protein [Actinomycetota bacterium]